MCLLVYLVLSKVWAVMLQQYRGLVLQSLNNVNSPTCFALNTAVHLSLCRLLVAGITGVALLGLPSPCLSTVGKRFVSLLPNSLAISQFNSPASPFLSAPITALRMATLLSIITKSFVVSVATMEIYAG